MGHAAQAAQGTEGAKVAHAIKFSQTSRGNDSDALVI